MNKLTLIDRAFFLKKTPLFGTFDLDLLLPIADKLQIITFESDQPVFDINEAAYRIYFIVKGSIEIRDENNLILETLSDDDFFGDESIFNEKPRGYKAVSRTHSTLLALSRTNLLTIISECPSVAVGLLQAYTSMTRFRPRKQQL